MCVSTKYKKEIEGLMAEGQSEDEAKAVLLKTAQSMLRDWEAGMRSRSLWKK